MADWELTEFNKNLLENTYPKSADLSGVRILSPMPLPPLPPPAMPPPPEAKARWYTGPSALTPESMVNMMQYYRERPGAFLDKPVRLLASLAAIGCAITGLLLLTMLTSNYPKFTQKHPVADAVPANTIGIVNPDWVVRKSMAFGAKNGSSGFFDFAVEDSTGADHPQKYVFVSPEEAQRDLEQLVKLGYLTAHGAPPDVVRDFKTLKDMGITTGTGIASVKSR
ncbi:MAG TPA: hypothetical protein VK737_07665 [Opitutales bacterium]|jgi:hypothetical protein|nr:hypothetical protein [Opitutales bacterium]